MEPTPPAPSINSSDDAMLRRISKFVWVAPKSGHSYQSRVWVYRHSTPLFMVEFKTTSGEVILAHVCGAERSLLEAIRIWGLSCPAWTSATFYFRHNLSFDPLICELCSLLRSVPSLVSITLSGSYLDVLPTLVCDNPHLTSLELKCCTTHDVVSNLEDAQRLALCLSRNSVLQSCSVEVSSGADSATWAVALRPFTSVSMVEANVTVKRLEVRVRFGDQGLKTSAAESLALESLLRKNTTLESLEFDSSSSISGFLNSNPDVVAQALATNRTLKRFVYRCNNGVITFNPGTRSWDSNLTSLELRVAVVTPVVPFIRDLARLLARFITLQHVQVVFYEDSPSSFSIWEIRSLKPALICDEVCTQDLLEAMMRNELREIATTTRLQSLVVGCWTVHRVDGQEWQMLYTGPSHWVSEEFEVRVKMRK